MDKSALKLRGLSLTTMRISIGNENPKELINHFIASAKRSIKDEFPDFVAAFPSKEKIDEMAINLQTLNTRGTKVRSLEIVASHDLPNRILNISQPIDIIWGEFDVTLIKGIDDAQSRMKELIPDVKFHIIPNSGHWIQFEEYDKFNSTIEKIYL